MPDKPCLGSASAGPDASEGRIRVVLDTNVVLDWLLFDDASVRAVAAQIEAGRWRWIGTTAMLHELDGVLARPELGRWRDRAESALGHATRWCAIAPQSVFAPPPTLRCADPDDQMFIDLAVERRAGFLFSRDKAVLKLARPASRYGVAVLRPAAWDGLGRDEKRAAEAAR